MIYLGFVLVKPEKF
ncbi:potassium-transporting ATPase subunit F [Paenibacillus sp. R14(2021)]